MPLSMKHCAPRLDDDAVVGGLDIMMTHRLELQDEIDGALTHFRDTELLATRLAVAELRIER